MPHDARLTKTSPIRPAPPVPDGTPADDGDPDAERIRPAASDHKRACMSCRRLEGHDPLCYEQAKADLPELNRQLRERAELQDPMAGDKSR